MDNERTHNGDDVANDEFDSEDASIDGEQETDDLQADAVGNPVPDGPETISVSHAEKLNERRYKWVVDYRKLGWGVGFLLALTILVFASYFFNSKRVASTFINRADEAAAEKRFTDEVRWLQNYLLLHPNNLDVLVRSAIAADSAADQATRSQANKRIELARKRLALALSSLGDEPKGSSDTSKLVRDIRERYINRLLQLKGYFLTDARDQVVLLDADKDDPQAHMWMAEAVAEIVLSDRYRPIDPEKAVEISQGYYRWLSQQQPGYIVQRAIELNPDALESVDWLFQLLGTSPDAFGVVLANEDVGVFRNTLEAIKRTDTSYYEFVEGVVQTLGLANGSHAKLLLANYHLNIGDSQTGHQILIDAAAVASQWIEKLGANAVLGDGDQLFTDPPFKLDPEMEATLMDYYCILRAAGSVANSVSSASGSATNMDQVTAAKTWLEQLRSLELSSIPVPRSYVKELYTNSGQLELLTNDGDRAVELWREGMEILGKGDLDLSGNVASGLAKMYLRQSEIAKRDAVESDLDAISNSAKKAIDEFAKAIDSTEQQLRRQSSDQLGAVGRVETGLAIRSAEWRLRIAKAMFISAQSLSHQTDMKLIALLRGEAVDGRQVLAGSLLDREIRLSDDLRFAGIQLLALAYQRQNAWDLVGTLYSEASDYFHLNLTLAQSLVQQSGNAWQKAGNQLLATQQFQRARLSAVPSIRLAAVEADFRYQTRILPNQRNWPALRSQINELGRYLDQYEKQFSEDLANEKVQLQVLEAQLPPDDISIDAYLESVELADSITKLAEKNPDNLPLQAFAAERLAAAGELERANKVVESLLADEKMTDNEKVLLRARVLSQSDAHKEAAEVLLERIDNAPTTAAVLAPVAADFALRAGDSQLAERILLRIPDGEQTPANLYSLYRIANLEGRVKDALSFLDRLHTKENYRQGGAESSQAVYSLLIDVQQRIEGLLDRKQQLQSEDPSLAKARAQIARLLSIRPRLGEAVAMKGWVAFAEQNYGLAVDLLRAGIASGDRRMKTRQMLWRALMIQERFSEAEQEIQLASQAMQADVDPYDEVSNQKAIHENQFARALESSEQIANENPEDAYAWLTFAKFVLAVREQAVSGNEAAGDLNPAELLDRAKTAIQKAEDVASDDRQRFAVESSRVALAIKLDDVEQLELELVRVEKLELPAKDRFYLEAQVFIALGRKGEAIDRLRKANELDKDANVQRLLAEMLRANGNHDESVKVWRQALAADPDNPVVRTQLATTIVSSGNNVDWDEIARLLNDRTSSTNQNRLVYAMLLMSKGDFFQRLEAIRQLRLLAGTSTAIGIEASRMQAALLVDMIRNVEQLKAEHREQLDLEKMAAEAKQILQRLADRSDAGLTDQRNLAIFLIGTGVSEDLEKAKGIIDTLKRDPEAVYEVLRLEMLIAQSSDSADSLPSVVDDWAEGYAGQAEQVEVVAGEALMRAGFVREGLQWFRKAYENDEATFGNYIVALSLAQQHKKAAEIAANEYEKSATAIKAVLLLEALLALDPVNVSGRYESIIEDAENRFPNDAAVLESIGTWAMQKRKSERAIALYMKVLSRDPLRLRALNNLAMIFAETPGREIEGLQPINQAIKISGEKPELLDTKGTVLLRSGRVVDAIETFKQAIELSDEPRYKFHLVQALVAQGSLDDAKRIWKEIDFAAIDVKALTQSEREDMRKLHEQFGTNNGNVGQGLSTNADYERYTERVEYVSAS
ncbi:tetratricopeptide repeat protein [Stieleria sp. JC731]|nr:tetratricopeptide repeat protein [Stieleria sp. JC731]